MTLSFFIVLFTFLFYVVVSEIKGDYSYMYKFIMRYFLESISLVLLFGSGIIASAKVYFLYNTSKFFHLLIYYFNRGSLYDHQIFSFLERAKARKTSTTYESYRMYRINQHALYLEYHYLKRYLLNCLQEIEKTFTIRKLNSRDIVTYFEREFKAEREIVYGKFLRRVTNEDIRVYYEVTIDYKLDILYRNFNLLKTKDYPVYYTIEFILNEFYCVFQAIDKDIAFTLRKIEKEMKYIPETMTYFKDIPINSIFIADHRVYKKTEETKAIKINTNEETQFLPEALVELTSN